MAETTGTRDNLAESDPPEALSRSIDRITVSAKDDIAGQEGQRREHEARKEVRAEHLG